MRFVYPFLFALVLAALPTQAADFYRTYSNARFGTVVQYPASFLAPRPEADNGDGRRFISRDGAIELTVYAFNNALERSVKSEMSRAISDWKRDGARLTYQKAGADWFTLSGYSGDDIFYEKTLFKKGVFHTLIWQYPQKLKTRLDAPVTRSVRSFMVGSGGLQSASRPARPKMARPKAVEPRTNARATRTQTPARPAPQSAPQPRGGY